jgi:tripartite-type tricarboxylate transporter receptor subunit TctC
MRSSRRKFIALAGMSAISAFFAGRAGAQNWPSRPLTMVVPFAAGGPSDAIGRILAPRLGEVLGQPVIVENVAGAGGMTGSNRLSKAVPDGYQFLLGNTGTIAFNQTLYKNPTYNTLNDFAPVTLLIEGGYLLIARKDFPANDLREFIAYAKENQDKLQYGSAGPGSISHIACVLLNNAIGTNITHIPYRGSGPAMQDVVGGRLDFVCEAFTTGLGHIQSGTVKPIAILSSHRSQAFPNLATAHEQGLADFRVDPWTALFLPKGTPDAIVQRLDKAAGDALDTVEVRQRYESIGNSVVTPERRGPVFLADFVRTEIAKWAIPIKASGVVIY